MRNLVKCIVIVLIIVSINSVVNGKHFINYVNNIDSTSKKLAIIPFVKENSDAVIINKDTYRIYPDSDNNNYGVVSLTMVPRNIWISFKTYINVDSDSDCVILFTDRLYSSITTNANKYGLAIWLGDETESKQHLVSVAYNKDGYPYSCGDIAFYCNNNTYIHRNKEVSIMVYFGDRIIVYMNNQKVVDTTNPATYNKFYFYILMNTGGNGYFDVYDIRMRLNSIIVI